MNTRWLQADNPTDVTEAGRMIKSGGVVALPTETVYGLAADASQPYAVEKIFVAKGRPKNHPLIVHICGIEQIERWATQIPSWLIPVLEALWPGPLTILLPKHPSVSSVATGGLETIGLRMPAHPVFLSLLQQFELAVAAPSANPYQRLSPTRAEQVFESLEGKIDAVLDGGPCGVGTESTILKVTEHHAEILRAGPISQAQLQALIPVPVSYPHNHMEAVSGNKKVHYRPHGKVVLTTAEKITSYETRRAGFIVCSSKTQQQLKGLSDTQVKYLGAEAVAYRQQLYAALYAFDKAQCEMIYVEAPPQEPEWLDIWDRLSRAAYKKDLP